MNSRRLMQIRQQLSAQPVRNSQLGRDAEQVARNLHLLLRHSEKLGALKRELAVAAGLANDTDDAEQAVKKLDEITVPSAISAEQLSRRVQRLRKKPARYLALASQCAKFMGISEDEILEQLFDGTDYGSNRRVTDDNYDPTREIVSAIRRYCSDICASADLEEYWRKLLQTAGRYVPRWDRIIPAAQSLVVAGNGLKGSAICVDEMVPIPSVSLVRRAQSHPVDGTLAIAPEPEPLNFDPSQTQDMPYLSPIAGDFLPGTSGQLVSASDYAWDVSDFEVKKASYLVWLDVRLAIGPQLDWREDIGPSVIGPLIELRSELEAEIDGETVVFDNPFGGVVRWAKIRNRWHKTFIRVATNVHLPQTPDPFFDMPHEWYFAWGELSANSLEHVLSRDFLPDSPDPQFWPRGKDYIAVGPLMQIVEDRLRTGVACELADRTQALRVLLSEFRKARISGFKSASDDRQRDLEKQQAAFAHVSFDH